MFAPPRSTPPSVLARKRPGVAGRLGGGIGRGRGVRKKVAKKKKEDWVYPDMSPGSEERVSPRRVINQYTVSGHPTGEPSTMLEWCAIQSGIYASAREGSGERKPSIPAISWEASVARGVARSPHYKSPPYPISDPESEPTEASEITEGTAPTEASERTEETPTENTEENSASTSSVSPVLGWSSVPRERVDAPQVPSSEHNDLSQDDESDERNPAMEVVTPNTVTRTKWVLPEEGEEWRDTLPVVSGTPSVCPSNFSPQRLKHVKLKDSPPEPIGDTPVAEASEDLNHSSMSPITPISESTVATKDTGTDPASPAHLSASPLELLPKRDSNPLPPAPAPSPSPTPPTPTPSSHTPAAPCTRCGSTPHTYRVSPLPPSYPQPVFADSSFSPQKLSDHTIEEEFPMSPFFNAGKPCPPPAWDESSEGDMDVVSFASSDNDEPYATKDFAFHNVSPKRNYDNLTPRSYYRGHQAPEERGPSLVQLLLSDETGSPTRQTPGGRSPLRLSRGSVRRTKREPKTLGVRGRQKAFALKEKEAKVRNEIELEQSTERIKLNNQYKNETSIVCGPQRLVDVLQGQCESSREVMHTLITMGNMKGLEYLLERGEESINSVLPDGSTPLITAVRCNRLEMTKQIINLSANIDSDCDLNGWSAVHHAASRVSPSLLSVLLGVLCPQQRRLCANKADKDGATPMHVLLRTEQTGVDVRECVTLFLSAGADLTLTSFNESPAEMMLREDLVDILATVTHQILPHLKRLQVEGKGDKKLLAQLINSTSATSSSVVRMVMSIPFADFDQKEFAATVAKHMEQLVQDNILILSIFRDNTQTVLRMQVSGIPDSESVLFSIVRRCRSPGDDLARELALQEIILESEEARTRSPWSPPLSPVDEAFTPKELPVALSPEPQEEEGEDEVTSYAVAEEVVLRYDKASSGCLNLEEWNAMLCELGSVSISTDDFEAMCRSRRINPSLGLDPTALSDLMTSSIEESLRELLCVPKIAQKVSVDKMRVRHMLNGKGGVVVGYRKDGVVLVDFVDFKGTPIGLRNLSWEGQRGWLKPPEFSIVEETKRVAGVGVQMLIDSCEDRSCPMGKWVQYVRPIDGEEEDPHLAWRLLRVCGRKVTSVKQIPEVVGRRRNFKMVFTLGPTACYGPVTVKGLKKRRHLNGMEGTVVALREGGTVGLVKLQGISAATPIHAQSLAPCKAPKSNSPLMWQPRPGARVVVQGLKIHSELNDQIGIVSKVRSLDGVVFVQLPEIQSAPLRPVNLRPLREDEGY